MRFSKAAIYTANGNFTTGPKTSLVMLLMIAGGASGASADNGGSSASSGISGGGGELVLGLPVAVAVNTTYAVVVGGGGTAAGLGSRNIVAGGDSSFNGFVALGARSASNACPKGGGASVLQAVPLANDVGLWLSAAYTESPCHVGGLPGCEQSLCNFDTDVTGGASTSVGYIQGRPGTQHIRNWRSDPGVMQAAQGVRGVDNISPFRMGSFPGAGSIYTKAGDGGSGAGAGTLNGGSATGYGGAGGGGGNNTTSGSVGGNGAGGVVIIFYN